MSGPKTSRYTLTAEQRRILAEQRKIERRKAAAAETIRQTQQTLRQMNGMFRDDISVAAELSARTGSDNGFGALIAELNALISTAQPRFLNTAETDVASIERAAEKTKKDLASARQLAEKIAVLGAQNEKKLKDNLQAALSKGFSAPPAATRKNATSPCAALQERTVQRLHEFRKNDALPRAYIAEIDEALAKTQTISSETFLKNTVALVVEPLIKKIGLYMDEYEQYHEEFETLYSEYCALCSLCGEEEKEYACSRASVEALQSEIDRLQAAIAYDDEQAYISKCLDDVMAEMGYCVLGSREVTKRNGSRFRNKLYSYEEGTAVNITYSSDGKIAMELGGIDTSDRIPTAQETGQLCDSMDQFCEDFREVEKRLLAKGVVLAERISLLPPGAEYAQIINTADYSMTAQPGVFHTKKQRKAAARPKTMRRE